MTKIRLENVVVGYTEQAVISGLSLDIQDGSLFTLLGPSGCGKTTLLRAIAGFVPVRSGKLFFGEHDVTHLPAHLRDIGFVFQDYALFPDKSVFDNVAYGLRARKKSQVQIKQTVNETLERVGLSGLGERLPAALSGGQRQRVALARALAIKPTVLLMDEPLSNLDAKLRHQVRETIADLQREIGITTVLVTHDQEEALVLSDQIGLLRAGQLEQVGTPHDLYANPVSRYTADFVGAANALPVRLTSSVAAKAITHVDLAEVRLQATASTALSAGKVLLIARSETLQLVDMDNSSPSTLAVTVKRRQYLGAHTLYRVVMADGNEVSVQSTSANYFEVGTQANLVFNEHSLRVVAA